jgi:alanyl-tRNA synthetase
MHRMDSELQELSSILGTQRENIPKVARTIVQDLEASRSREKELGEALADLSTSEIPSRAKSIGSIRLYVATRPRFGEDQIIAQGEKSVVADSSLIYISLFSTPKSSRVVCFVGDSAQKAGYSAGEIVRKLAPLLGGSGGGSSAFAQGGGPSADGIDKAASAAEKVVSGAG